MRGGEHEARAGEIMAHRTEEVAVLRLQRGHLEGGGGHGVHLLRAHALAHLGAQSDLRVGNERVDHAEGRGEELPRRQRGGHGDGHPPGERVDGVQCQPKFTTLHVCERENERMEGESECTRERERERERCEARVSRETARGSERDECCKREREREM